ncbi:FG-GAP-like repeat-containing protein [Leptolyngbyaceae cyanobacterium UHCC 1019]
MADTIFDNNAAAIAGVEARWIKANSGKITLSSTQDPSYSLDATDTADYFKLTVSRSSNVIISLASQGGNANISLLDFDGTTQSSSVGSSNNNSTGLTDVIISDSSVPLQAGQDYYIRVDASNPTTTINYTLTVDTLPTSRSDLLWRDYAPNTGVNYLWNINNSAYTGGRILQTLAPNYQLSAVEDFNNDGTLDYFWRDPSTGFNGLWFMDSTGVNPIGYKLLPSFQDINHRMIGAADFNGDGNTDILWEDLRTNLCGVWLLNSQHDVTGSLKIDSPNKAGWYVQTVGDFNGDSKPDILYRNYGTGENTIWTLDNGKFTSAIGINSEKGAGWFVAGSGDFNGDNKWDLFWRNAATGANRIWYMDQSTLLSSASFQSLPTNFGLAKVISTPLPVDLAGNAVASAFSVGKVDGTATYNDKIGGNDKLDFYSFRLDVASKIDVTAIGSALAATTNFQITTANGTPVSSISTANGVNQQKLTEVDLNPGTYFVRLQSTSTSAIDYSISIGAVTEKLPVNLFPVAPLALKNTDGTPIIATQAVSVKTPFLFDLDYIVKYTGSPTNSFKVGFFLSPDDAITTSDYRLDINNDGLRNTNDVATIAGLAPDTNGNRTQRLTLPSKDDAFWDLKGDSTYYIGVIVDPENEIAELDAQGNPKENDNALGTSILVKDSRLPDLTGNGFNVVQPGATRGGAITVSGSVLNIGKGASDAQNPIGSEFEVGFYLSRNITFSSDDIELTFATFAAIAANGQASFNSSTDPNLITNPNPTQFPYFNEPVVLPLNWAGYQGSGTYYVLMVVDPGTTLKEVEGGTLNNVTADAITITV